MTAPLVSVVIPTKDRPEWLYEAVSSVLSQELQDLEVIVSDDGSRTPAETPLPSSDSRLRFVRVENSTGVSRARNRGLNAARGRYVAFLDDDDVWGPKKLERQVRALQRSDAQWACSGAILFDRASRALGIALPGAPDAVVERLRQHNLVPGGCSNTLVSRELVKTVGGFDPQMSTLADWDYWLRLAEHGLPAVITEADVGYRLHSVNMSNDPRQVLRELPILEGKHQFRADAAAIHRYVAHQALRGGRPRIGFVSSIRSMMARDWRMLKWALGSLLPTPAFEALVEYRRNHFAPSDLPAWWNYRAGQIRATSRPAT